MSVLADTVGLLDAIEWSGRVDYVGDGGYACCPACTGVAPDDAGLMDAVRDVSNGRSVVGHTVDCAFARLRGELRDAAEREEKEDAAIEKLIAKHVTVRGLLRDLLFCTEPVVRGKFNADWDGLYDEVDAALGRATPIEHRRGREQARPEGARVTVRAVTPEMRVARELPGVDLAVDPPATSALVERLKDEIAKVLGGRLAILHDALEDIAASGPAEAAHRAQRALAAFVEATPTATSLDEDAAEREAREVTLRLPAGQCVHVLQARYDGEALQARVDDGPWISVAFVQEGG